MYTKEVHVKSLYKVAEPRISKIQGYCVFIWLRCKKTLKLKIVWLSGIWPGGSLYAIEFPFDFFLIFAFTSLHYKVIAGRCISTDINFPKVSSWQVIAGIIIALPGPTSRNHPLIPVGHKCCVVVQTILSINV